MKARKPQLRQRAIALRAEGWPLRRIANEVGAALSSVSVWVRDVQFATAPPRPIPHRDVDRDDDVPASLVLRLCGRCGRDLPLASFGRHPSGHQWWCRDCYRAYFRARAAQHRRQVHLGRKDRRRKARLFVCEYLRVHRCADCGEADPIVLEFHHRHEKHGNVADLVRHGSSVGALQRELERCIVVCANCHRVRTAASRGSWRLEPERVGAGGHLTPGERRNMIFIRDRLLASQCVDCGDRRIVVLDFDHVGAKTAHVTELARRGYSLSRLEAEVTRCEVRCANCHRRRTMASRALQAEPRAFEVSEPSVRDHGGEPP